MEPFLEVRDLDVAYLSHSGTQISALTKVSFSLARGEAVGVLGESGSGKSSLATALLGLLAPNGRVGKGNVLFEGADLLAIGESAMTRIRGARIGLIYQEPSLALHPTIRVRNQVEEVIRAHEDSRGSVLRAKTDEALGAVFGNEAASIGSRFPHELSGGQRQRVLIAQAIGCRPSILVADEPTAALDPVTQAEILALFTELRRSLGLAVILITHNPALLVNFADRVLVLYAGEVAELGPARDVLSRPQHPYTKALLESLPAWPASQWAPTRLQVIPGESPDMDSLPPGCRFEPRCSVRMEQCTARMPPATVLGPAHSVSCFKFGG